MYPLERVFIVPKGLLLVFQVFGLFPWTLHEPSSGSKALQSLLSLAHCVAIVGIFSCCLYYAPNIFDTLNAIGLFVDIIQILAPILAHLIICIEAAHHCSTYRLLWNRLEKVFHIVQQLQGPQTKSLRALYFRCGMKCLFFALFPLILELRILWGISDNYWVYSRLAAKFSFIGCRLSYLQLSVHLQIIKWLLQQLEEETRNISNDSRSQLKSLTWEMHRGDALRRIHLVQQATSGVMELTGDLNTCYQWSLTANLTNNFLSITIAYYWNYRSLYFNNLKYQLESMLVSWPLVILLCFVMYSCEDSFKPAGKIVYHLNRIRRHPKNLDLHHGIRRVLLQLLNQPFSVNAMNFLGLNFKSLTGFISAMVTYLVIFIQFMPKDGENAVSADVLITT